MLYIILSIIAGALGLYCLFFKNLNLFKEHGIPYRTPIPIFGNLGAAIFRKKSAAEVLQDIYNVHPKAKYVGMFEMTTPAIILRDPDLIKFVTLKNFDTFSDHRSFVDEDQDPLIGKNLFFIHGDKWRQARSLLRPAFTSSKMKIMFKLMSICGAQFANYLAELPSEQRIIQTTDVFAKYTNDVFATCSFGVSVDSMRNSENQFYVCVKKATTFDTIALIKMFIIRSSPSLARLMKLQIIRKEVVDFFRDLVENIIKTRDEKGVVRPDMIQLMMENRGKEDKVELSLDDMMAHAYAIFFGGFDSTSTMMCFAAHEIAVNDNVQQKLQEEIDQVLEETNGQVTYEAINNMEYLEAVIHETFRLHPVAVAIDRLCAKDFELPPTLPDAKPFTLKKGQSLWIPVYGLHHDPKYFEDPDTFDPDRFRGERKSKSLNCGVYLPFGIGPRMCIGIRFALLDIKVLLFHLLARCELKICEKTPIPLKIAKDGIALKAEGDFWLKIERRGNIHPTLANNSTDETQ